jgi:hypothetical protein
MQRSEFRGFWISAFAKSPDCMAATAFIGDNGLGAGEWFPERSH